MATIAPAPPKSGERTARVARPAKKAAERPARPVVKKPEAASKATRPIEVDLISALYPHRSLTPERLQNLLETKGPRGCSREGSLFLFRIEQKDLDTFVPQLRGAFAVLTEKGVLKKLGSPRWKVRELDNIDHAKYLERLSNLLGKGGVSDADMERVSAAWMSSKAR